MIFLSYFKRSAAFAVNSSQLENLKSQIIEKTYENCLYLNSMENKYLAIESDIKLCLSNGTFWDNYALSKSVGDGHCMLHSVISVLFYL